MLLSLLLTPLLSHWRQPAFRLLKVYSSPNKLFTVTFTKKKKKSVMKRRHRKTQASSISSIYRTDLVGRLPGRRGGIPTQYCKVSWGGRLQRQSRT
jgi:hypothetical protein